MAWFVKASVFHSVNSAPAANGGSNPAWECCIDRLFSKEFVAIQIASCIGMCNYCNCFVNGTVDNIGHFYIRATKYSKKSNWEMLVVLLGFERFI